MLEDLLEYHQKPEDSAFVVDVMANVQREKRIRRLILTATGAIGVAFGAIGAIILSEPIAQALSGAQLIPISVAVLGGTALVAWLFQDEVSTGG